jgi:DNA-binding XRE family transcriptional regulator
MKKSKPFAKLRGRMAERGVTQEMLAKMIGQSKTSVNCKLNGQYDFNARDMKLIKLALNLESIDEYFFND